MSNPILDNVRQGEGNAIHSKDLEAITGLSERALRMEVASLRRQGVALLSSDKGYFTAKTLDELDRFIARKSKMARSILLTLRPAKRLRRDWALRKEFSQITRLDERTDSE